MTGLAPKTLKVFKDASKLSCIRDYVLVGGSALALQINHRLSEDLDFCKWVETSSAENAIPFRAVQEELKKHFTTSEVNVIDFDQADYLINGEVKFQFFNEVGYKLPSNETIPYEGNIRIAPINTIAAMKIKTMFQRNVFRDYYDVYAIVKGGHLTFSTLIEVSCVYNSRLNADMIIKRLVTHKKFREEKTFGILSPKYDVSTEVIGSYTHTRLKLRRAGFLCTLICSFVHPSPQDDLEFDDDAEKDAFVPPSLSEFGFMGLRDDRIKWRTTL